MTVFTKTTYRVTNGVFHVGVFAAFLTYGLVVMGYWVVETVVRILPVTKTRPRNMWTGEE